MADLKIIHPRYVKKGLTLYTSDGVELEVVGNPSCIAGVYRWMCADSENNLTNYEWDCHIYGDYHEPVPELYRKDPTK